MNRPRVNEIFGLRSNASGYTIFGRLLTTDQHNCGERLLFHERTQSQANKRSIDTTFCNSPTIPSISCARQSGWEPLVGRRAAGQRDSRRVPEGGTNTPFARLALCVLVEQETFAIVHPGGVYASY